MLNDYIEVVIDGEPVPQARPKMMRTGHVYTPEKSRVYKEIVRVSAKQVMKGRPPAKGPLLVTMVVCKSVPQSWSKKKQQAAYLDKVKPEAKPDLDNYIKAVWDGCNGILWEDDGQVVQVRAEKKYSSKPCVIMKVYSAPKE